MMLPILISLSVAPVSYFFCASAPVLDPASSANAATAAIAVLLAKTAITFSLWSAGDACVRHGFLGRKLFSPEYHFAAFLTRKSPPRRARKADSLVGTGRSVAEVA